MVAYLYRKIFIPSGVELMVVVKGEHVHVLKNLTVQTLNCNKTHSTSIFSVTSIMYKLHCLLE